MRNLTATLCLILAVLLGSAGGAFALQECPSTYNKTTWTNCVGSTILPEGTTPVNTGDHYQGAWINGKPEGRGVLTGKKNGKFEYIGEFKEGGAHGIGTFTTADGEKYVGEWRDDKRHGQGTLTFADGRKYVGEWRDDNFNGQGTATFPDGEKYVGEWRDNKRHGQGTYTFADGDKYVGEWRDGNFNGQGTYTYADGEVEEGVWENGEFKEEKRIAKEKESEEIARRRQAEIEVASWNLYSSREKHLIEQVLNYSTTGKTEGEETHYWKKRDNSSCIADRTGNYNIIMILHGALLGIVESKNSINIKDFIQTSFKVKIVVRYSDESDDPLITYTFGDDKLFLITMFIDHPILTSPPEVDRLRKAWSLMFKKCPGKKSLF